MGPMPKVADIAASQWGLLTTAQARSVGVSPHSMARLANQGVLERLGHGVYRLAGAPPAPLEGLRAAWLTLKPARQASDRVRESNVAVASHRSAAWIHGLGNLEADVSEFTSTARLQSRRGDVRIHRGRIDPQDWVIVDGLPVTSVIRTVDDLAAARLDGGHLASVVRDALIRRQADIKQALDVLGRRAHLYNHRSGDGEAFLTELLQEAGVSESVERAAYFARPVEGDAAAGSDYRGRGRKRQ